MSRKYGRSKTHGGGAGLQFDKLLKACSNSKKPSVIKTAGALGRFGIASFTSTRNSSLDYDSCGVEESRFSSLKRPRFDVEQNLAELRGDSFRYGENLMMPSPTVQTEPPPTPMVIKPKKFFKSRNPENDHNQNLGGVQGSGSETCHLPPLPMPITIPTPRKHEVKKPKGNVKKGQSRRKESTSSSDAEMKAFYNTTNVSPPDTQQNNKSSRSPSIKLRIFKDKKTAKFVSVSDTSLPPKLEPQTQKVENIGVVEPKRRGRKPKAGKEPVKVKPKPEKMVKPEPVTPQRRSGRLTRNSTRLRSSDSVGEMPVLTVADDTSESLQYMTPPHEELNAEGDKIVQKVDSAEKLVQRLEEEDSEFRELTAMLSSMEEEGSVHCGEESVLPASSPAINYQEELPVQPSPINYSTTSTSSEFQVQKAKVVERPPTPESAAAARDFRSILEDEWDDNYEEESPRKSSSPCKVSRFEMPEFMTENYDRNEVTPTPEQHEFQTNTQQAVLQIPQPQLNSSYAVRNLLSEITGNDAESTVPAKAEDLTSQLGTSEPQENPSPFLSPEKLTPTKEPFGSAKKASIFKSRMTAASTTSSGQAPNPKKRLALYKHKFGQEVTDTKEFPNPPPATRSPDGYEEEFMDASERLSLRRSIRVDEDGNEIADGAKVYCSHETKKLFTVVRNVKAIHELQESGEVHEFDGDIWYILEDLKESNPISSRCLSAITLATRCMEPAFRMHLRAHGTVAEFSKELRDAPDIPVLGLAAATVLFVLSQDRLNMDLDTESMQLILALAKTEQNPEILDENPEYSKHKQRIIDLVAEMQHRGHAKHIKIDKITASELALETLLFLTSKRAGEWVKRELRTLGGLDYIVTEVEKTLNYLDASIGESGWSGETSTEFLWKIDRCLKVLQQVTFNHEANQKYLLACENQTTDQPSPQHSPDVFVRLFQFLSHHLSDQGKASENFVVLRESLFSVLRLLVNLTHDYRGVVLGSEVLSARDGFLRLTLHSIFTLSTAFSDGKGFDLLMHALCLLLNIVEHSRRNRQLVLSMSVQLPGNDMESQDEQPTLDALIQLFFRKERDAKTDEASTDDILTNSTDKKDSSQIPDSQQSSQESKDGESSSVQDIIDKLIETAGKHMENSMIAAHISLLIAYLIMDDPESAAHVQMAMPNSKFLPLMVLLKKLFNFMSITTSSAGSTRGLKATSNALKFFEKCDPESAMELKKVIPD